MHRQEASAVVRSLFLSWYPSVVRYAWRVCGRLEVAEEAVQEAFMALYSELVKGTVIESPKGWTLVVVRREIAKYERAQGRRKEGPESWAEHEPSKITAPQSVIRDDLASLFSVLTQREEEVLLLRLQAFGYDEIATQLGISRNSVKTLLARAFRKLREAAGGKSVKLTADRVAFNESDDVPETLQ